MNLTCSAVLDLAPSYVLGALDEATDAAVRDHLATCPRAHEEFAELGGVVPYLLAEPEPVAPRGELRARVMASFAAEAAAASPAASLAASGATTEAAVRDARNAPASTRVSEPGSLTDRLRTVFGARAGRLALAALAIVAIVALGIGNLLLQADASSARKYADNLNRALALAATPDARVAVMTPQAPGNGALPTATPGGIAVVPPNGSGILVMHDLPATQGSQVYEAWFVAANGRPVPVGSFRVGTDGHGYLEGFGNHAVPGAGLVVGLTREPGPGATTPTLPMVAAGNAQPAPAQ